MFENEKILALSWKQPYGSLMLPPINKIETRTWETKYRGLVLICTSKEPYDIHTIEEISGNVQSFKLFSQLSDNKQLMFPSPYKKLEYSYPLGKAIGIGRLIDCREMGERDENKTFVKYREGLWCHVYEDVKPIKPFDWKGSQGFREVTSEEKKLIEIIDGNN